MLDQFVEQRVLNYIIIVIIMIIRPVTDRRSEKRCFTTMLFLINEITLKTLDLL